MKTKHFRVLTYGVFFILLSFAAYAQESGSDGDSGVVARGEIPAADQQPPKAYATETQEQRLERMLKAFDRGNYQEGVILVSFSEQITKEEAARILGTEGFSIAINMICPQPEVSPGNLAIDYAPECYEQGWNDNLKIAEVHVIKGQEKQYAERLIHKNGIVWIEPEPINEAGSGIPVTMDQSPGVQEPRAQTKEQRFVITPRSNNAYYISGAILIILFVVYLLSRKKH